MSRRHDDTKKGEGLGQVDRRSFLKLAGFSVAGAAIAGCERTPVEKAIPFLIRPEEVLPGKATWYATTCSGCPAACGILVKHRDGRPIKIEGNPDHPISKGGVCVVGQSMLLGLYDSRRFKGPKLKGNDANWNELDAFMNVELNAIRKTRGKVRFLTGTVVSPTTRSVIAEFLRTFADGSHVEWDPFSQSAILDAHARTHGIRALPQFRFERASVIVGFDADLLGTWLSPVEFTKGYTAARSLADNAKGYAKHVQFETHLSVTGAKADDRFGLTPAALRAALSQLYELVDAGSADGPPKDILPGVRETARHLLGARGRSLVVCGVNGVEEQLLVNMMNERLGNYGKTIDLSTPSLQHRSNDEKMIQLLEELRRGEVAGLFMFDANPLLDIPSDIGLKEQLSRVPLVVSFAERVDETTVCAHAVCSVPHHNETWSDAQPRAGVFAVSQPSVQPMGNTRAMIESIASWLGRPATALDVVTDRWRREVFPRAGQSGSFEAFWNDAVHNGYAVVKTPPVATRSLRQSPPKPFRAGKETSLSLTLTANVSMPNARHSYNAWLQEVPDPITKIAWDNCAVLSPGTARVLSVASGDVVRVSVSVDGQVRSVTIPAWVQPAHPDNVVAIATGYGSVMTRRFVDIGAEWFERRPTVGKSGAVGVSASSFIGVKGRTLAYRHEGVTVERTGERVDIACTQPFPSLTPPVLGPAHEEEPREILPEITLEEYRANPAAGKPSVHPSSSMWSEEHAYSGHHWGMVIDPNACTGCSACVVSCQAENNIPVVGKDEVMRNREMHWIRIDRYIDGGETSPRVAFQPMMCQQCDNAPCETVCPVQATVHSSEGINQQVYNRCVGTRYCANNCPYKIRRFNWFDYPHDDPTENMILNPDVVVRERGVMEKCSFCYQRIQEAKIRAKRDGVQLSDDTLQTACQQSCPANAIVFGDMNDPRSAVAAGLKDPRYFRVLEELEVRPSVGYTTIVRNTTGSKG